MEGIGLGTAVAIFDVLHHDLAAPCDRTLRIGLDLGLVVEEGAEIFDVQGVLVEGDQIGDQSLEVARHRADGVEHHDAVPHPHRSLHQSGVDGVEAGTQNRDHLVGDTADIVQGGVADTVLALDPLHRHGGLVQIRQELVRHTRQAHLLGKVLEVEASLDVVGLPRQLLDVLVFLEGDLVALFADEAHAEGDEGEEHEDGVDAPEQEGVGDEGEDLPEEPLQGPEDVEGPILGLVHGLDVLFVVGGILVAGQLHRPHLGVEGGSDGHGELALADGSVDLPEGLLGEEHRDMDGEHTQDEPGEGHGVAALSQVVHHHLEEEGAAEKLDHRPEKVKDDVNEDVCGGGAADHPQHIEIVLEDTAKREPLGLLFGGVLFGFFTHNSNKGV